MKSLRHRLRYAAISAALLLLGLWLAGSALWQLGRTAMYVHESVVVTGTVVDVRQKPFESWAETLGKGNWSCPGDISYQPIVRFTLPGGINAIRLDLAADNVDYNLGQEVSIISPPTQPGKAHIYRWKFLWGAVCMRLGVGALLTLTGYALLRRLKGKSPAAARNNGKSAPRAPRQEPASAPTKTPRRKKSGSATGTTTRRRRKADDSTSDAPAATPGKPRRSRKKKAQEQSPELPF